MITKEEFDKAYNQYPTSKLELFYFKHFSTSSTTNGKWVITTLLLIPFVAGFLGTMANWQRNTIMTFTFMFFGILFTFGILWIYVYYTHNFRIRRIRKKLGVSLEEYEKLTDMYYPNN